jgi:hypothetical protein
MVVVEEVENGAKVVVTEFPDYDDASEETG